jgi:hypothetical protein
MNGFPHVDPIPLPAPVWLFKLLDIVTLSLHFVAMQMLVGGLLVAILLNLFGKSKSANTAAAAMARRLTIVMTYVINLGVPPLLFAQVLYGRAIYTSSVLIGAYWIGVVFALIFAYWLLYRFTAGLDAGRRVWWIGAIAWLTIAAIANVYTTNMTLMLRPEVWQQMYAASSLGTHLPPHDPTVGPRLLCVFAGAFMAAGLWMIFLSGRKTFSAADAEFFAHRGGWIAAFGGIFNLAGGTLVYSAQTAVVQQLLASHPLYRIAGYGWFVLTILVVLFSLAVAFFRQAQPVAGWLAAVLGFLAIALLTLYRDGIRDMTLLSKGYDVWDRTIVTNWSVVGIFLFLFIAGLGVIGWLISVVARATRVMESAVEPL